MCKSPRSLWRSTRRPCCFGAACYIPRSISMCRRRRRQHREREMPLSDKTRRTNTRKHRPRIDSEEFLLDSLSLPLSLLLPLLHSLLPFSLVSRPFLPRNSASQKSGLLSHHEGGTVLKAAPRRLGPTDKSACIHRYLLGSAIARATSGRSEGERSTYASLTVHLT